MDAITILFAVVSVLVTLLLAAIAYIQRSSKPKEYAEKETCELKHKNIDNEIKEVKETFKDLKIEMKQDNADFRKALKNDLKDEFERFSQLIQGVH